MAFAQHPRVRLLFENKPLGKGHAVRNGLKLATGDIILIQDADLEYDLDDYQRLLDPIRKLEVSFVLGSRRPVGKKTWQIREFSGRPGLSNVLNFAHLLFTLLFNAIFRQRLRDPLTMYKVFRRDCIHNIHFECNRFDFDHELVGKLVRNGFSPVEIDSRYRSRSFDEGKKILPFRDPPTWIKACLKHRFSKLYLWPESS
jgi:glycosyltransferase involved in cell wall biosynthesis